MNFNVNYSGDRPVYAVVRRLSDWAVWQEQALDFVTYDGAALSSYLIALTAQGGDQYGATKAISLSYGIPYAVNYYEQTDATPSDTNDLLLRTVEITGSTEEIVVTGVTPDDDVAEFDIIRPGIPTKDGCPILTRINAFIVPEMVLATLEMTLRDRAGRPIDLSQATVISQMSDSSASASSDTGSFVQMIMREVTGVGASDANVLVSVPCTIHDAANGVVRCTLPREAVGQSGIYTMTFGYYRNSKLRFTQNALMSVEPNMFGALSLQGNLLATHRPGCPTIQELRMQMWDSSPNENVLLDDLEFSDEQIVLALVRPIQYFNSVPPPLGYLYNTTNFPWKHQWIEAAIGNLYKYAEAFYRRNRLEGQAGGINIDDLNKYNEYLRLAQLHEQAWRDFVLQKKVELNMQQCVGEIGSTYGGLRSM